MKIVECTDADKLIDEITIILRSRINNGGVIFDEDFKAIENRLSRIKELYHEKD